jgi:hypothetical protein
VKWRGQRRREVGESRGRCMMWESEGAKWREEYRGWSKCGREMNMKETVENIVEHKCDGTNTQTYTNRPAYIYT